MRHTHPHIDEHIQVLRNMMSKGEEYKHLYDYTRGLIDGLEHFGKHEDMELVVGAWERLGDAVASYQQIAPYYRLRDIVDKTPGALAAYHNDFYKHDFCSIVRRPNDSFIWMLRDMGTHLHFIDADDTNEWVDAFMGTWGGSALVFGIYHAPSKEFYQFQTSAWHGDINELMQEVNRLVATSEVEH